VKGQDADPSGVCNVVSRSSIVYVGGGVDSLSCGVGQNQGCLSLDYAIYTSLDTTASSPTVNVIGPAILTQNVEITGFFLFLFFLF
jgi:hypothetical protein